MNNVYIVCENITYNYIPKPIGMPTNWNNIPLEPPMAGMPPNWNKIPNIPLKPRFEPIIPQFYPEPADMPQKNPNNVVCICKDLDTAKHYLNGYSNRYILGPYNIM
jgi:hypothetical protein